MTEISAPSDGTIIQLKEDQSKIQIAGLKGTLDRTSLSSLGKVTEIRILKNEIRQIETGALCPSENLKVLELDLSGNKNPPTLTKGMFSDCNLEELFLKFDYNNPSTMDKNALEGLHNLKVLGIDSLRFTHLEKNFLVVAKNLTSLTLSNIHVATIDEDVFEQFTDLEALEIVHNIELEHIPQGLFNRCVKLKTLNLRDNAIKNLSWDEFQGLSSLEELSLGDNRIENFDADKIAKNLPKLKTLSVEINAAGCEKEEQFVRTLKSKFDRSINVSSNKNYFLCN